MKRILAVALVAVVACVSYAGPFKRIHDRRHAPEIVLQKDGTSAIKWADGSVSQITLDKKTGKLQASPKSEASKYVQFGDQKIWLSPAK